ncbi:unnamed protein product [Schistocephalus solidus]|uniref:Secreted protein n=1 Tax=Schistocephalus solidus TaxID=70667 RepID=A0A183ST87_SCHSO|nr:unnamed protein product [Schistocephalus solidus]
MLLWPPLAGMQLPPVAPGSCFFTAATHRATATTGELNEVRVPEVVCAFTPGTFAPFPLLFPLSHPPCPRPLLFQALSAFPSYFSFSPSCRPFLSLSLSLSLSSTPLLLIIPLPFCLSPHTFLLLHGRKSPTARATCNHVGGPG